MPPRLVIKPLKLKPKLPTDFEDASWGKLREAIHAVQVAQPVACSLEELYRAVEDMCLHKLAPKLYEKLREDCDKHAAEQMKLLASKSNLEHAAFLQHAARVWDAYCSQMLLTRQIFLYLDRTYVISSAHVRSIFDLGLQLFRTHLNDYPDVERKLVDGLLVHIEAERNGETVDRQLVKNLLRMLSSLGRYEDSFQPAFITSTVTYYGKEGQRLMQELEVPQYLIHCEKRLHEEFDRCDAYLESGTRRPLIETVETCLIEKHIGVVLQRGVGELLDQDRIEDLARMYNLCARVHALDALCSSVRSHIQKVGSALVLDQDKDPEMVQLLLALKERLDAINAKCFHKNEAFVNALKDAFENFINQRANKPAELIAKYIDAAMKGGSKGKGDEELENKIDAALVLFRFIQGKDVFEAFYKRDLAKRLLLGRSASMDAEKLCISKLKAECGSQFTSKLEGMFKDVDLSRDIMASFKQSTDAVRNLNQIASGMDVNVHVLTSGFWPTYPVIECALPDEISSAQSVFKDFYLSKHTGRKLVWCNSLGTCVLKARFDSGVKELAVSLLQATILMMFNEVDEMGFASIKEATGIEDRELRRTLQSLACGKERVLTKDPKGKEVGDDDIFSFNAKYTSKLIRVKINAIQMKETVEENKKTNEQVLQDRQYQVDAAIVRIMKTRKTLSHKLLVSELFTQLKFPIQAADLKKRIESLIDREYLERDGGDSSIYNYLA